MIAHSHIAWENSGSIDSFDGMMDQGKCGQSGLNRHAKALFITHTVRARSSRPIVRDRTTCAPFLQQDHGYSQGDSAIVRSPTSSSEGTLRCRNTLPNQADVQGSPPSKINTTLRRLGPEPGVSFQNSTPEV